MIDAIPRELASIESLAADADGAVGGEEIERVVAGLLKACGEDPSEWVSARSLAASAAWDTRNRFPVDWRTAYRWLEVSVVHGGSEGWIVHVRGVDRNRSEGGAETSRLLLSVKLLDRHDAWRVAEVLAHFFDC